MTLLRHLDKAVGAATFASGAGILSILYAAHATGLYAALTAGIGVVGLFSGAAILRRSM